MSESKSKYNFISLMNERHSVRNFQKKEIPENLLKEIITTAQRAASWENVNHGMFTLQQEKS